MMMPWWVEFIAFAILGSAILLAVELRLKAMRDLFRLALVQRDSFDAQAGRIGDRITTQGERIDIVRAEAERDRAQIAEHENRILRLEGRRI